MSRPGRGRRTFLGDAARSGAGALLLGASDAKGAAPRDPLAPSMGGPPARV